jgi:16S rRNA (cytosine967-C5)-methyltransferase
LLERAAAVVRAGGQLVYSTCSIEPEENEAVLGRFLRGARQFAIARPRAHPALTTPEGFVRTYPHRHGTDGFFAAVLVRQG